MTQAYHSSRDINNTGLSLISWY